MQKKFAQIHQVRYPLIALALIVALLGLHTHFSSKISSSVTQKKEQTLTITSAGFLPNQLKVGVGELISLMVVNADKRVHKLVIGEIGVSSANLAPYQTIHLEFTVNQKGIFRYVSDSAGYPEPGFQGVLIVE